MFSITATSSVGAIAVGRDTAREAIQLAMSYINQGYSTVTVTDLATGEKLDENKIVAVAQQVQRLEDNA